MIHRIDIPSAPPVGLIAADIIIATLRDCGMDPEKARHHPMVVALMQSWLRGESTDAKFRNGINNMLIFNPGLKIGA